MSNIKSNYKLFGCDINNLILLKIFIFLTILDYSGDFLILTGIESIGFLRFLQTLIRQLIVIFLLFLGIIGLMNIPALKKLSGSGILIILANFTIIFYGLSYGLLENDAINASRESLAFTPLLILPILVGLDNDKLSELCKYLINSLVIILGFKIFMSQIVSVMVYGGLSWKVILRLNTLLLLPFSYYLLRYLRAKSCKFDLMMLLIVVIEVFMTQARALNLSMLLIFLVLIFFTKKLSRVIYSVIILISGAALALLLTNGDLENIFGIWYGEHFSDTANYRYEQFDILLQRFSERPLEGFGFGYFSPEYRNYADLDNPFLLELDLINFATKIGILLSVIYFSTYILFLIIYKIRRYSSADNKDIAGSYLIALLGLLFYSLFQTAHSSFIYWIVYLFTFALIFSLDRPGGSFTKDPYVKLS